jgi:cobalt/nickel transport system ATP-binding protein
METAVKAENVNYNYYGKINALSDVNIEIGRGDRMAIIGSNGSGKSTLLQTLDGLIMPDTGKVFYMGREVSPESLKDREFQKFFRGGVGYVFQDSDVQLFCPTVLDEMVFGPMQLGISEEESLSRAHRVMADLGIEALKDRPSYMLSGGEKKRVALGSVLVMDPEVLLLDEPTNGLDPKSQMFLIELMFTLNQAGKTIVVATHDLALVDEMNGSVAVLSEEHRIEKVGPADVVLSDQELLLKVNLVHEHVHAHGGTTHRHVHSHYQFHRH